MVKQVLLFINSVDLFTLKYGALPDKYTSVAFDLRLGQFVARGLVIQYSIHDKAQINHGKYYCNDRQNINYILCVCFVTEKKLLKNNKYQHKATEQIRQQA